VDEYLSGYEPSQVERLQSLVAPLLRRSERLVACFGGRSARRLDPVRVGAIRGEYKRRAALETAAAHLPSVKLAAEEQERGRGDYAAR
jgi:hypothetical protein